jgi:hypothetical protein
VKPASAITFGLTVAGLTIAACAHSGPAASPTRKADNAVLKACVFRTADEIAKSPACNSALTEANITSEDLAAIKSCKAMSTSAMNADATCKAQMARHPGVF